MSHVHHPVDPRQTAVSDLFKVILCLMAPRFEHSTLVVCAKQRKHSPIAALNLRQYIEEIYTENKRIPA
jgi:hypothetical protein